MAESDVATRPLEFTASNLWDALEALAGKPDAYDTLDFGVVAMDESGVIVAYNQAESRFAGIPPADVIGLNFFSDVAPCTNNYLVAGRFEAETELDETIDYVFTVKMRPTRVRLRLLKRELERQYLAVKWS